MSHIIQLHLNSNNATSVLGLSSWLFDLPHALIYDPRNSITVELTNAEIPFSYYTINDNNNSLHIKIGTPTHIITLTNGNYTCDEIAEMLNDSFTSLGHAVTVTYSIATNKFTFTDLTEHIQIRDSSTCAKLIGFIPNQNSSSDNILVSPYTCDVMTVERFVIASSFNVDNITSNQNAAYSGILASFGPNSAFNGINTYDGRGYRFPCNITNLTTVTLTVLNENFEQIDFNNIACYFTISIISR